MFFKKRPKKVPARRQSTSVRSQRVISYYTASRHQLNQFERKTGMSSAPNRQLRKHLNLLRKWWFLSMTFIALLAIAGYLLSLSTVAHIDVDSPVTYRSLAEYKNIIEPALKQDWQNRIKPLLKSEQLQQTLAQAIPEASSIIVTSSWFGHDPVIKIINQIPMAVFNQKGQLNRFISTRGKILMLVDDSRVDITDLPLLQNDTGLDTTEGEQFMRPDEAEAFVRLVAQFNAENKTVTYTLPTTPHELIVSEAGKGYVVKFLLDEEIVRQFGALRAAEKKLAEIGQVPGEYIDVRLADKAYYR